MTSPWPEFDQPIPIDATRSWTALFNTYDQRTDDCYYIITLHGGGTSERRIMAEISLCAQDLSDPGFAGWLKRQLHDVAASGRPNTEYKGSMEEWMKGGGRYPVDE